MKAFRFGLENVMRWQEKKAEKERRELERLAEVREGIRRRRTEIERETEGLKTMLSSATSLRADEIGQFAAFSSSLKALSDHVQTEETHCETAMDAQRQRCVEADRQYKVLEKFKGRRMAEWQKEFDRELEDTALTSYLSKWGRDPQQL